MVDGLTLPCSVGPMPRGKAPTAHAGGPIGFSTRGDLSQEEVSSTAFGPSPRTWWSAGFWTTKLPPAWVKLARLGGIGVHPSLLPRPQSGPDPYFAAIDAGDEVTGVTVHRIEADYDTGAILAARNVTIAES